MPTELNPTYDKAVLRELLERVEGVSGPDRELDAAITVAFYPGAEQHLTGAFATEPGLYWRPMDSGFSVISADPLTASLDAALALVERVLLGVMWQVGFDPDDGSICARLVTAAPACMHAKANHDTPALALLAALLRALSQEDGNAV